MSEEHSTMSVPSTGARLCLLIAALMAIFTVYLLTSPVLVNTKKVAGFDCGTVLQGPKTNFARGICGKANAIKKDQAVAMGVGALTTAVGGFLVFGMSTRQRRRTDHEGERRRRARHDSDLEPDTATDDGHDVSRSSV